MRTTLLATPAILLTRFALAASFLSAVADRLGLWGPPGAPNVAWGNFKNFLDYTAQLLWFVPTFLVPAAGWTATVLEVVLAILLILGLQPRLTALASALLLAIFATTMTIAFGPEPALSYSVWTAAAAALLLATLSNRPQEK